MPSSFRVIVPATTDDAGTITWTVPPPDSGDYAVRATFAVLGTRTAGIFEASIAGAAFFGDWGGAQPFGPISWASNDAVIVTGSGLKPNTQYLLQVLGYQDYLERIDWTSPTPTGITQLVGTDQLLDLKNIAIGTQAQLSYGFFPCSQWAGLRLGAKIVNNPNLLITLEWWNLALDRIMATRNYTLGVPDTVGQKLEVNVPNLGDMLLILVTNNNGGA